MATTRVDHLAAQKPVLAFISPILPVSTGINTHRQK